MLKICRDATPCANCPYRKDAPLALWSKEEFDKLEETENEQLGVIYGCHKKDGSVCRGWFIDQREREYPSIMLRLAISEQNLSRDDCESILAPEGVELFGSVSEMIEANFPGGINRPRPA